jgi:signal transduction histidine kinase
MPGEPICGISTTARRVIPNIRGCGTVSFVSQRNPAEPDGREPADRWISDLDLSQFLLRACHDLRNPLRAIRAHAELIRKSPGAADIEQRLDFIIDGARRIDLFADGLSSYSIALNVEQASFQLTRMDVTLRTALARLAGELRNREAEVTCGELPHVSGDPDRLVQVFEKLLQNALRHGGRSSPRIHIAAEKQATVDQGGDKRENAWIFAIRDNGCGIDAEYLERIFKPFERLHAEREGVGMGLAICRAIVERHGGRLWAESTPGTGSTFFFTMPVVSQ